ncbi:MAG: CaiB/BaiF CoA transferase family protein [Thermodesulfobacteriota bacterium]
MQTHGALSGIRVIDLSRLLPGPYASMILADHGAEVIAIEDQRYGIEAMQNNVVNRNKRHMTLNLKAEAGQNVFFELVKTADVVLEGFRPGVTRRLGVDYDAVAAVNPSIVYCSITGYGQTGPYRDAAGHDVNYLSTAGVLDLIGESDRPPSIPGIQIADMAGGGMNAVIGILMALYARQTSGKGQYIDISMTDGSLSLLSMAFNIQQLTAKPLRRSNSLLSHRYACYNTYETADGRCLSIGAVENRFWKNLCLLFEVPQYIDLQYDETRRKEIIAFFRETFKAKPLAHWQQVLAGRDVCWAPVRHMSEALTDPGFQAREMIVEIKHADGSPFTALGTPVKMSATPGGVKTPPPDFGQDSVDVLKSLGYSDADVAHFKKQNII